MTTKCLFHVDGHAHSGCVTARQFGLVWLVSDGQTMYWVGQRAINAAPKFAAMDDEENYSMWCRATDSSVRGYLGDAGHQGIQERGSASFLRACRIAEAKIEAVGGIEYAALVAA